MAATEAQARRALRRAYFPWSAAVADPRKAHNQRHEHQGMLSVLAAAFACGKTCLRRVEEFSADLSKSARRALGVGRAISDTALFRLLAKQRVSGLRETVWAQVQDLIQRKVVGNDLFPLGVLSIDGKSLWASQSTHVEGAKTTIDPASGVLTAALMSVRAVLTSSRVRPCRRPRVSGSEWRSRSTVAGDAMAPSTAGALGAGEEEELAGFGQRFLGAFFGSVASLLRQDSASMSMTWQCWAKRSTKATTQAAPGKTVLHCL